MSEGISTEDETKPKVVHKTGISENDYRNYAIINRVRSIDRTNDKFMKRTRSTSRPRYSEKESPENIPVQRTGSSGWTERGTKESIGGVLGIVKPKKKSSSSRGRARAEDDDEERDDGEKRGFFRGRSSSRQRNKDERGGRSRSRGPLDFLRRRSLSRRRKNKQKQQAEEENRGRTKNRNKLPPLPPGGNNSTQEAKPTEMKKEDETSVDDKEYIENKYDEKKYEDSKYSRDRRYNDSKYDDSEKEEEHGYEHEEHVKKEDEEEVDAAIDKLLAERQLIAEIEAQKDIPEPTKSETRRGIDGLGDDDIMELDERNTSMHVACLLHHSSTVIIERLENEPELTKFSNNANETPLHYAAMDKKGVSKDVLKMLIQLNPEAVKQPNVQNSLPIHLACMAGAPSTYAVKTFLKMYPKATMMQSEFPLLFEEDMVDTTKDEDDESDDGSQFVTYRPKNVSAVSGIASMFACAAPNQAAVEIANERARRKQQRNKSRYDDDDDDDEGPKVETGFSPLHLAVMNSASTSVIDMLIKVNPKSINLKTSQGRTALDCAQYIVRQHWLYGSDDEDAIQNTFGAIERLEEAFQEN